MEIPPPNLSSDKDYYFILEYFSLLLKNYIILFKLFDYHLKRD